MAAAPFFAGIRPGRDDHHAPTFFHHFFSEIVEQVVASREFPPSVKAVPGLKKGSQAVACGRNKVVANTATSE